MQNKTVYLKCERNVEVQSPDVFMSDMVHDNLVKFREHFIDAHIVMVRHDGKRSAEKAHQTDQCRTQPLLPAFMFIDADPLDQNIRLPDNLHTDVAALILHQLHHIP